MHIPGATRSYLCLGLTIQVFDEPVANQFQSGVRTGSSLDAANLGAPLLTMRGAELIWGRYPRLLGHSMKKIAGVFAYFYGTITTFRMGTSLAIASIWEYISTSLWYNRMLIKSISERCEGMSFFSM